MAVRELKDPDGTTWRVWCIQPEAIHPVTRAEDYLAECYQLGWIVFETTTGDRKRRLCPFPKEWFELEDEELRALRDRAEVVPARKLRRRHLGLGDVSGAQQTAETPVADPHETDGGGDAEEQADLTDLTVVRTFRYPGGRVWSAAMTPLAADTGSRRAVLRFTSGSRSIDAKSYPSDWPDLPDDRLVDLLRLVATRPPMMYTDETPRRRWNDPPRA